MLKTCCAWLLFCLLTVHAVPPKPPVSPVGPFDNTKDDSFSPPPKPEPHEVEGDLFQGDIQIAGRRIGNAGSLSPWPNGVIPYRFDCSVVNIKSAMEATRAAMDEWESRTCIRFVEKRPQDKAFLEIFRASGCWATFVGYRKDTKTQISIGNGCDYKHVMVHELGHVIGFWHEQSRPDRDEYIKIHYNNVIQALRYNFNKVAGQTSNYGLEYDYGSIMHYPWNAFAIDRRYPTIEAIKPLNGKRPYVKLSNVDVEQTKRMYKCSELTVGRASEISRMNTVKQLAPNTALAGPRCSDQHKNCPTWARHGHCDLAPDPMLSHCAKSCGNCGPCVDKDRNCQAWASYGFCLKYPYFMLRSCKTACGLCKPEPTEAPTTRRTTTRKTTTTKPTTAPTTKRTTRPTTKRTTRRTTRPTTKPTTRPEIILEGIRKPRGKFTGVKCEDRSTYCKDWQRNGRCKTDDWVKKNCLSSCKRFDICDAEPIKPIGNCASPFGIGWDNKLSNRNFRSTSSFYPGGGWGAYAYSGRLYLEDNHKRKEVGAWCANPGSKNQYLQIDLGRRRTITAVATQGRDRYFEHVKSYTLSLSNDETNWREYKENGKTKVFEGNCDHFTPVLNILKNAQVARHIRFHPVRFIGAMCLRVEVYGCSA